MSSAPPVVTAPKYGTVYLLPYLVLIFCRIANLGGGAQVGDASDEGAVKTVLEALAYAAAGLMVTFNFVDVRPLLGRLLPFYLYVLYSALTYFWSGHPDAVLLRVGHNIGMSLAVVGAAMWAQDRREKFISVTAVYMLIVLALSVAMVFLAPSRGLSHAENAAPGEALDGARWVGITWHPNLLGSVAMAGVWSAVAVLGLRQEKSTRWWAGLLIVLSAAALYGSDSRTSIICAAFCAGMFYIFQGAGAGTAWSVFFKRALLLGGIGSVVIAAAFLIDADFVIRHLAPSARAGASDALSDRPLIWAMGFEAVRDNPMGWTYDLLGSYWDVHGHYVFFPHFHNGYLDVAVKGGIIGEILLWAMLFRMAWSIHNLSKSDFNLARAYGAFFACNLLYNVIDTGFDRESIPWPLTMVAWAVVEATVIANARKVVEAGSGAAALPPIETIVPTGGARSGHRRLSV